MKKILAILIVSMLWSSSLSANTFAQDNVLKWISKYDSLTADTKLIFAAKRIISIHIKMSIIFLRFKNNPKQPIINKITERIKK